MIALVCVVATALACCGAHVEAGPTSQTYSLMSRQDTRVDMAKPKNNSERLWLTRDKVYLVYRSEKNDTEFGGEAQCVQMKAFDFDLPRKKFLWNTLVRKLKVRSKNLLLPKLTKTGHMEESTVNDHLRRNLTKISHTMTCFQSERKLIQRIYIRIMSRFLLTIKRVSP
uniref:Putative secreted protein n=1 Tax=Ixodes ricinus TaxID=34613 RepID=V5H4R0_IXORI